MLPHPHLHAVPVRFGLVLLAGWRGLDVCASFVLCFRPAYRVRQTVVQEWGGIPFVPMYRGVLLGILGWYALCVYLLGCAFGYILCVHTLTAVIQYIHTTDERCQRCCCARRPWGGDL